jgi:hypothetical protein
MPYPENVAHLEATILQMCDGDIKSFMVARKIMDDINYIELSSVLDEKKLSAFFLGRCFLEQVISNLAADSMFEFPPKGTKLELVFRELSSSTGKFLNELIINNGANYIDGIYHLNHAVGLYYGYLRTLSEIGRASDLGNQDGIWQEDEMNGGQNGEYTSRL